MECKVSSWPPLGAYSYPLSTLLTAYAQSVNIDSLRTQAVSGDPEAQTELDYCYYNGYGVEQNYPIVAEWLRKAAEQGMADAQYHLGDRYFYGEGVTKNIPIAI